MVLYIMDGVQHGLVRAHSGLHKRAHREGGRLLEEALAAAARAGARCGAREVELLASWRRAARAPSPSCARCLQMPRISRREEPQARGGRGADAEPAGRFEQLATSALHHVGGRSVVRPMSTERFASTSMSISSGPERSFPCRG